MSYVMSRQACVYVCVCVCVCVFVLGSRACARVFSPSHPTAIDLPVDSPLGALSDQRSVAKSTEGRC